MNRKIGGRVPVWTMVVLLSVIVTPRVAASVTTLFTSVFTNPTTTAPVLTFNCPASPGASTQNLVTNATPITGTTGQMIYKCASGPAFNVGATGNAIPTIVGLPAGWVVSIIPDSATPSCVGGVALVNLSTVGFSLVPPSPQAWDYCVSYINYSPPATPFSVIWSQ
jgi:hypothetical protein